MKQLLKNAYDAPTCEEFKMDVVVLQTTSPYPGGGDDPINGEDPE